MAATKQESNESSPLMGSNTQCKYIKKLKQKLRLWHLALLTIIFIWFGLVWIFVKPMTYYQPPKISINSLSVSPFNVSVSNCQISANWTINLSIKNPNKLYPTFYSNVGVSIYYGKEFLARVDIKSFSQKQKEHTPLNATMVTSPTYAFPCEEVAKAIDEERTRSGVVSFHVVVRSTIKAFGFWAHDDMFIIFASCNNLKVEFSSDSTAGTMLGSEKVCAVEQKVFNLNRFFYVPKMWYRPRSRIRNFV